MRIGVNFRAVQPGKIGGMEHHVRCLVDAMLRTSDHDYIFYVQDENIDSFAQLRERATLHRLANPPLPAALAEAVRDTDPDVVFHPFLFIEPLQLDAINAIIIPDLRYLHYPEQIPAPVLKVWRRHFPASAARAEAIFTLSEHSRGDIVRFFKVPEGKVHVASPAVDPIFFSASDTADVRRRYGLPDEFIFYPADTWPHKNHHRLFQALKRLKSKGRIVPLVLSGFPNAGEDAVVREIKRQGLAGQVIRLGYVPRRDLPGIYQAATALVFPSTFEGWGMPVSEAMAMGTPVLCGNAASVPEVAGDAALYFDPFDERDIAAKLEMFFSRPELRRELAEKGPAQARRYTWDTAARTTLQVLEAAARPMLEAVDPLPLVSIIIPSYNQGGYLESCIDSVLSQDYPNLEVIVLDAASTDATREILPRYSDRVRWISRKDRGQTDAINQGLRAARGEIHGYLCSDDALLPGAIRTAVAHLVGHPQCDLVYGQGWHVDAENKIIEPYPSRPFNDELLMHQCFICQPAAFWRRRLYDKIGWYDDEMCLHGVMDYEFWMRAADGAKIAWIDDFLAHSRLWSGGKTLASIDRWQYLAITVVHRHYGEVPLIWINAYVDYTAQQLRIGWLPRSVGKRIRQLYKFAMKRLIFMRFNGLGTLLERRRLDPVEGYSDGWMGTNYVKSLPLAASARRLRIRGSFPFWPIRRMPVLRVWADGIRLGEVRLPAPGGFQAEFSLPARITQKSEVTIRLHSPLTFVPADHDGGSDDRHLSCQVESLSIES